MQNTVIDSGLLWPLMYSFNLFKEVSTTKLAQCTATAVKS